MNSCPASLYKHVRTCEPSKQGSTLEARGSYKRSQNQEAPSLELEPSDAVTVAHHQDTGSSQNRMCVRGHWDEPLIRFQMSRLGPGREHDFSKSVGAGEGSSDDRSEVRPGHTKAAFQECHVADQTLK